MKIRLDDGGLILTATSLGERRKLLALYARGHLHFVCKAYTTKLRRGRSELWLTPSVIAWARPKGDGIGYTPAGRTEVKLRRPVLVRAGGYDPQHPEKTLRRRKTR